MDEPLATRAAKRLGLCIALCFACERQFALRNKVWVVRVRPRAQSERSFNRVPIEVRRLDIRTFHLGRYYCSRRCARAAKNEYNDRRRQSRTVAEVLRVEVPR